MDLWIIKLSIALKWIVQNQQHIININMHISVRRNFYSSFKQAHREKYKSVVMKL